MARILENSRGKRTIMLTADDVISVVREYQSLLFNVSSYEEIRKNLSKRHIFIPEEII